MHNSTRPRHPCGHRDLSTITLVTEMFHVRQAKSPCYQVVIVPNCDLYNPSATAGNYGHMQVATRLQAMCDWGRTTHQTVPAIPLPLFMGRNSLMRSIVFSNLFHNTQNNTIRFEFGKHKIKPMSATAHLFSSNMKMYKVVDISTFL